jgi:hypothetical protein
MNGLWTIEFASPLGRAGSGIIVLNEGRLLGGDASYYYSGEYTIEGDVIQGRAHINRFDPNGISVLGNIDHYSLDFTGTIDNDSFTGVASLVDRPEMQVRVRCTKKEDW